MPTHLYIKSAFSLSDSTIRIPDLVKKAKEYGYQSVALTDHHVMYGVPSFLDACREEGIHGIIGLEVTVSYHEDRVPFVLLAQNNRGYQDLMVLSSLLSSNEEFIDVDTFIQYSKQCVIIAYGEGGWIESSLIQNNPEECRKRLEIMKEELPSFVMAESYQDSVLWREKNAFLKRICSTLGIQTIALNKTFYLNPEDNEASYILNGIRKNLTIRDAHLVKPTGRHFLSIPEMQKLYDEDDLRATDEIAEVCKADGMLEKTTLPKYHVKNKGMSSVEYLRSLCQAGIQKRCNGVVPKTYQDRMKFELETIINMHFEDYFLIVYDYVCYARKKGILVGPGRGSAVGSLVAYSLGITMIDPIKYNLLFERFLNPERVSLPDIDTDIPDNRREEVIQYVYEKYGEEHVGNILTFSKFRSKQALHDVAKVMTISSHSLDFLDKAISRSNASLRALYAQDQGFRRNVDADRNLSHCVKIAMQIEGLQRHTSIHAAGIIMSRADLQTLVPIAHRKDEGIVTIQYPAECLEERGLIKMDFLGVRNLTTLDDMVHMVQKVNPSFKVMDIPLNDAKTYALFSRGETSGVFQFESDPMRQILRQMKPSCFDDIVVAMAIYRPGPMDYKNVYLKNRANPKNIQYVSEELKPILQDTYGVMIYQEQMMMVAQKAAGFSLGKADILRRACSKKKEGEFEKIRQDFITGCLKNGYSEQVANYLFDLIEKFEGYGFNKSHAVAYSFVAYRMAYIKANYPLLFYVSILNSSIGEKDKTPMYITECMTKKIPVFFPDANQSYAEYTIREGGLQLPLSIVNGISVHVSELLIEERNTNGPFKGFVDFVTRAHAKKLSREQIESLINAGACDCFEYNRATDLYGLDRALRYAENVTDIHGNILQIDDQLLSIPTFTRIQENEMEHMENEKAALGFRLGLHPILSLKEEYGFHYEPLASLQNMRGYFDGVACIDQVKQHFTKTDHSEMAFLTISDETGNASLTVFSKLYLRLKDVLVRGAYIHFRVKIDDRSMIAENIEVIRKK